MPPSCVKVTLSGPLLLSTSNATGVLLWQMAVLKSLTRRKQKVSKVKQVSGCLLPFQILPLFFYSRSYFQHPPGLELPVPVNFLFSVLKRIKIQK